MLLSQVIDLYLKDAESIKRYSKHSITAYSKDLYDFTEFCRAVSKTEIEKLDKRVVKNYMMNLSESGLSKISISRKLSSVRSLFKYAFQHNYIKINPVSGISNPRSARKLPSVVSYNEILEVINNADEKNENGILVKVIFELLYGCALRVSELCSINNDDIDLKSGILRVKGKGNKVRIVPVGEKSVLVINQYLNSKKAVAENKALLTNDRGSRLYPKFVYRIVNKYLSNVTDVERKSPHALRHSAATHMLDSGADLGAVKEILGHENLSTTQIYTHVSIERLKSTYKKSHPKS